MYSDDVMLMTFMMICHDEIIDDVIFDDFIVIYFIQNSIFNPIHIN